MNDLIFENFLSNFSFALLLISMVFYWGAVAFKFKTIQLGTFLVSLANISLTIFLILRWMESGHFPLSNLFESLMFLSWSFTALHLLLEKTYQQKLISCITSPIALFTNAFATLTLPVEMQHSAPLVPALQSNWLMMHVTVMILSYSALICGSLLSIAFLVLTFNFPLDISNLDVFASNAKSDDFGNDQKDLNSQDSSQTLISATSLTLLSSEESMSKKTLGLGFWGKTKNHEFSNSLSSEKIKLINNLDNLSYRILGIAFPFLTIGILSGAVWANEAWGSYWSWDPKETWALLTWLVYAIYLHTRITKGWSGKKPAIIASLGFFTVWICFLGVNLIGQGLHSYGWIIS